jgi:hypothetical protein
MVMPVRITQTRTRRPSAESLNGLFRQVRSTSDKFTLYSLRHFYAVQAIVNGLDIYVIARNMGTSVAIIESYYGKHATSVQSAGKLGG